ncbi:O-succinylbenzoate-CoA ligase [Rhodococcus opacus PD630]|uniref:long-chain-fatty-acid--CoA ligase n=1 Tax=Rhodococcus TaxID=1827 RepID=UPI00029CAF2B|nr:MULTISPECIES: long-chain-fatty-acid--CoA ligase [Rhodococcus]KXF54994.1 long-chain fatty acid--CoA ligase [Rhodococcus sp. SC4]RZK85088.1 MAG: long-chain-fatty-acid--CoA ligase [Rhodococcus sp. (in: high G+C Gram-positive bacteria)]AHK29908.1 2-succinylbenzoate--CoA ligase [Rhodococcus opacus PD630]EHI46230.1 O-succinylbenzoate-CoA ligase [Rhodococcus opacus PD630]KXX56133.1 long-chain fatty acid--CoA ligase [Rhodococcus sp. LB1]
MSDADNEIIFDRLAHWAQVRPDDVAVQFQGTDYTWSGWHDRILHIAGALAEGGIGAGDTVAFVDKNHLSCLEVTYAASLLGAAAAVPNWRLAGEELDYVINDSGARILFVGNEFLQQVMALRDRLTGIEQIITVGGEHDEFEPWLAEASVLSSTPEVGADATALILYSSGTTGRPKGVQLTHRNLIAHSAAVLEILPARHDDCLLVAMPLFHVGGSCYAIMGVHAGARCHFTREADAPSLFGALAAGANIAFLVPPVIAGVLAAGEQAVAAFGALHRITYGAAPMPLPLLRRALAAWPEAEFVQVYGMTECAGVVTALLPEVHRDPAQEERMASAGQPIPGVEMRIVDPATAEDVAPGETGELWWRSDQRTPGYLGKPEATAEAVTADGWLRSGDMGRADADGFVFIEDRLKDMIITGGENVYSPEIERVLVEHPAVAEVAVIGVPDDHWGETVKAVVVPVTGTSIEPDELIHYTRQRLAKFKCPTTVDIVDLLPRNPTGKILKRELRAPYWKDRTHKLV